MIEIREEEPRDQAAVRHLNEVAFGNGAEAVVVDKLRASCNNYVSFVAIDQGTVIGHILFTPATLDNGPWPEWGWLRWQYCHHANDKVLALYSPGTGLSTYASPAARSSLSWAIQSIIHALVLNAHLTTDFEVSGKVFPMRHSWSSCSIGM